MKIKGTNGHDKLVGEAGDDIMHGGKGMDALYGGDGTDILYGGRGRDTFVLTPGSTDVIADFDPGRDRIRIDVASPGPGIGGGAHEGVIGDELSFSAPVLSYVNAYDGTEVSAIIIGSPHFPADTILIL